MRGMVFSETPHPIAHREIHPYREKKGESSMWQRERRLFFFFFFDITTPLQHQIGLGTIKTPSSPLGARHPSLKLQFLFFYLLQFLPQQMPNCSLSAHWWGTASVPYLEEAVPGPRATRHSIGGHSDTAHSVVVPGQHSWATTQKRRHVRITWDEIRTSPSFPATSSASCW